MYEGNLASFMNKDLNKAVMNQLKSRNRYTT